MATESVTLNDDTGSHWDGLLRHVPHYVDAKGNLVCSLTAEELITIRCNADEMITLIMDGFSAIGELQWRAAAYDDGSIDADVFARLAPLQTQLAELVAALRIDESNADYRLRELEAVSAKPAAQPTVGA